MDPASQLRWPQGDARDWLAQGDARGWLALGDARGWLALGDAGPGRAPGHPSYEKVAFAIDTEGPTNCSSNPACHGPSSH